jgi:hypothetical protein
VGILRQYIQRDGSIKTARHRGACKERLATRNATLPHSFTPSHEAYVNRPSHAIKYLPLMFQDDEGLPFLSFTRFAVTGLPSYPRSPDSPKLSAEQADALDTIQFLADKYAVEVSQEKGDMFFINNRTILHARDKILDRSEESRRHLLRLCLRDTEYGRPIPDDLKRRWGDIFDGDQHRNGKWMLCKENTASFVSSKAFDSALGHDETTGSHG